MPSKDKNYNRKYYERNKEKALAAAKVRYELTKDQPKTPEQKAKHVERSKKSYLKLKNDPMKKARWRAKQAEWYQSNKDRILQERKEWRLQMLGTFEYRFKRTIQQAKQRGIVFSLSFEQFVEAANQPCHYCYGKFCDPVLEGSGLDRIDSDIGYEVGNVISCGWRCNKIKMDDLTMEETEAAIKAILQTRADHEKRPV